MLFIIHDNAPLHYSKTVAASDTCQDSFQRAQNGMTFFCLPSMNIQLVISNFGGFQIHRPEQKNAK
jgi:hypothetical protein